MDGTSPDLGTPEPPQVPIPPPVETPPPPRPRFLKPFLFWLFFFSAPASVACGMLAVYVHEFSHGLAALVTGGYFLGVRAPRLSEGALVFAYADAWSPGYQVLVLAAGIGVNLILGGILLWRAFRARSLVPRLLLFLLTGTFLSEFAYAFEGCAAERGSVLDTTMILDDLPSPALRWACLIVSLVGTVAATGVVSRGLFRCWERVFGALSAGRAFWVILLLSNPAPVLSVRGAGKPWLWGLSLAILIGVFLGLMRGRLRLVEPTPVPFRRWSLAMIAAFLVSAAGFVALRHGIRLGTYPEMSVEDIRPDDGGVAGILVHRGLLPRLEGTRPAVRTELFVSTRNAFRKLILPSTRILDVDWVAGGDRIIVVCAEGLLRADLALERTDWLWRPDSGVLTNADHGPGGEIVAVLKTRDFGARKEEESVYVYDPTRDVGALHGTAGGVGFPFFSPDAPGRAWLTAGDDLWQIDWPADGTAATITTHAGESGRLWLSGLSGDRRWFNDGTYWTCDKGKVLAEGVSLWRIGPQGFYAVRGNGTWELTRPDGVISARGKLSPNDVLGFRIHRGAAWIVLRSGEVRPIDAGAAAFRVPLPP